MVLNISIRDFKGQKANLIFHIFQHWDNLIFLMQSVEADCNDHKGASEVTNCPYL